MHSKIRYTLAGRLPVKCINVYHYMIAISYYNNRRQSRGQGWLWWSLPPIISAPFRLLGKMHYISGWLYFVAKYIRLLVHCFFLHNSFRTCSPLSQVPKLVRHFYSFFISMTVIIYMLQFFLFSGKPKASVCRVIITRDFCMPLFCFYCCFLSV